MILVLCDALSFDDLHDNRYPQLYKLAEAGAIGLMNCGVVGPKTHAAEILTLTLGQQQPSLPGDEQAFQVGEPVPGERGPAGLVYRRRTGLPIPDGHNIVQVNIASLTRRGLNALTLGAVLAQSTPPVRAVVCGNADTDSPQRRAALLVLDAQGTGIGDVTLQQRAPDKPYGRIDADVETLTRYASESDARLFVVQLGDTARVEAARAQLAPAAYQADRARALERLDAFLYLLQVRLADVTGPVDVLLVSPYAAATTAKLPWARLAPILAWGSDFAPGLLTSPTTRTPGLLANVDLAPTLLSLFHIASPSAMVGRPMRSTPEQGGTRRIADLARMDYISLLNARAVTQVMEPLGGCCLLIALAGMVARKRRGAVVARRVAPIFVYGLNLPAALLLAPILVPPTLVEYGLRIAAWMAVLTLACYLLARPTRIAPPILAALFCIGLVTTDAFAGQALIKDSIFSGYALSGIRYYGIGNEYLGVLLGFALVGGFAWLDDRRVPFPPGGQGHLPNPQPLTPNPHRQGRIARLTVLGLWILLALVLGLPWLGANAGSLIVTTTAFGMSAAILRGKRPTPGLIVGCILIGLLLSFAFGALDLLLARQGSSHSGAALSAAAHGRGGVYLAQIALRKLAMNLRLLFAPYLLLGAVGVIAIVLAAGALIGDLVRATLVRHVWIARGLPALAAAICVSLLFKDSGVVTVTFLVGSAAVIILWYVLTEKET